MPRAAVLCFLEELSPPSSGCLDTWGKVILCRRIRHGVFDCTSPNSHADKLRFCLRRRHLFLESMETVFSLSGPPLQKLTEPTRRPDVCDIGATVPGLFQTGYGPIITGANPVFFACPMLHFEPSFSAASFAILTARAFAALRRPAADFLGLITDPPLLAIRRRYALTTSASVSIPFISTCSFMVFFPFMRPIILHTACNVKKFFDGKSLSSARPLKCPARPLYPRPCTLSPVFWEPV